MMRDDLDAKIKQEFLSEFSELLEETEQSVFTFELDPGERETVDELFRLVHTLKGSSIIAGFNELAEVVHLFEMLLDKIRSRELIPDNRVIDVALKFTDLLHDSLWKLQDDLRAEIDTRSPRTWLEQLLGESIASGFHASDSRMGGEMLEMLDGNG